MLQVSDSLPVSYLGTLLIEPGNNSGMSLFSPKKGPSKFNKSNPGKCLTAASNTDGATITIQTCTNSANQQWTFTGGTVRAFGSKCLDVTNGNTTDGTKLQVWTCTANNANQQWFYTTDNRLAWTNHGKCTDLTSGSLVDGTPVSLIFLWSRFRMGQLFRFKSGHVEMGIRIRYSQVLPLQLLVLSTVIFMSMFRFGMLDILPMPSPINPKMVKLEPIIVEPPLPKLLTVKHLGSSELSLRSHLHSSVIQRLLCF